MHSLPPHNFDLFHALMQVLHNISQHSQYNMMTPDELKMCFAPTLGCFSSIVFHCIQQFDYFFLKKGGNRGGGMRWGFVYNVCVFWGVAIAANVAKERTCVKYISK